MTWKYAKNPIISIFQKELETYRVNVYYSHVVDLEKTQNDKDTGYRYLVKVNLSVGFF